MTFARSHSGGETDETNYDEDDGIGVAEVEKAATDFLQQKKYADGDNNDGPHEAADSATLASATNTIAHRCLTSRRSLLRTPVNAVPKHQDAHGD